MFKSIGNEFDKVVDSVSRSVNISSPLLDLFRTNNVVQLISRSSGRSLQIVAAPDNRLVVDGLGPEGRAFFHTHWVVINDGLNIVKLHNNNNYLCIMQGATTLVNVPPTMPPNLLTRFYVKQRDNAFICLESVNEPNRHVGILSTGQLKSALATGTELDAHFGVRLIHTPYGDQAQHVARS